MDKVRFQPLYSMASSLAHDSISQEANTLYLLCVLSEEKGVTSLGRHTRPACYQAPLEIFSLNQHSDFHSNYSVFFIDFR